MKTVKLYTNRTNWSPENDINAKQTGKLHRRHLNYVGLGELRDDYRGPSCGSVAGLAQMIACRLPW